MSLSLPAVSPHTLLAGRAVGEAEKSLMLCKHYPAIARTLMCYQHYLGHRSKTQCHVGCCEGNKLHPNTNQYSRRRLIQEANWPVFTDGFSVLLQSGA